MPEDRRPLGDPAARWPLWGAMGLGLWLMTAPFTYGWTTEGALVSDLLIGLCAFGLGLFCRLYPPLSYLAYLNAFVGVWLMAQQLVWGVPGPAWAGPALVALALVIPATATLPGSDAPPGWFHNPSSWVQRAPILALTLLGASATRGCRPVAVAAMLALLFALIGDRRRWRTAPWAVCGFAVSSVIAALAAMLWTAREPGGRPIAVALASILVLALAADERRAARLFLKYAPQLGQTTWGAFWNGGQVPQDDFAPRPTRRPSWTPPLTLRRRHGSA